MDAKKGDQLVAEDTKKRWIAGFWRRSFAFAIDAIILGCIGYAAGLLLEDFFVQHRLWGRLIGMAIGLCYFGLLDSRIGNGQSVGKKLLKVRLVDAGNATVEAARALGRYAVFALPNLLEASVIYPASGFNYPWLVLACIVVLIATADVYFYLFNRGTRQSLHDLLFGTFVVNVATEPEPRAVWPLHRFFAAGIWILLCAVGLVVMRFMNQSPFSDMLEIRNALMRDPLLSAATVAYTTTGTMTAGGGIEKHSYYAATLTIDEDRVADKGLARDKAKVLLATYPAAAREGAVVIELVYGYDIGISSSWQSASYTFTPEQLSAE
jgi:uncharacterized RDD family membrane protein YckC